MSSTPLDQRRRELSEFFVDRRARLKPEDVGLPSLGRRRVAGLRREEVASLAGVGVTWYSMLETGTAIGVSRSVISRVASVLRLSDAEHEHLAVLELGLSLPAETFTVDAIVLRALETWVEAPAYVATKSWDVLAWNRAFAQVWGIEAPGAPPFNIVLRHFVDPAVRAMHGQNWRAFAEPLVAMVRATLGMKFADERYIALVETLREDPDFAELWDRHDIQNPLQSSHGEITSPAVGSFVYDILNLSIEPFQHQTLIVQVPDEVSAARIRGRLRDISESA